MYTINQNYQKNILLFTFAIVHLKWLVGAVGMKYINRSVEFGKKTQGFGNTEWSTIRKSFDIEI